jgi:hypothetical protein
MRHALLRALLVLCILMVGVLQLVLIVASDVKAARWLVLLGLSKLNREVIKFRLAQLMFLLHRSHSQ